MQIEYVKIKKFRNLSDFEINFTKDKTVIIGQNASGKSNFIEAIVIIFKHLDFLGTSFDAKEYFDFEIIYICYGNKIKITCFIDSNGKAKYDFLELTPNFDIYGQPIWQKIKSFKDNKDKYLPKYIFAYYSGLGNSNRLERHFEKYKKDFADKVIRKGTNEFPKPPRMFYTELIHSQLSLLSFFIAENKNDIALNFLKEHLNIDSLISILLSIREPDWTTTKLKDKDPKFFGSEGAVKKLLYHLHDNVAFAPFRDKVREKGRLWDKTKKGREVVYLYISDFAKIQQYIIDNNWTSFEFFHVLNTANISQLLTKEGIKIRVKKKFADRILFEELSEGEQQLLTVLGLMRFTRTEETLFLLDEPDTHLNPYWRWKYMNFIDEIVIKDDKSASVQVIMTSHDPLTIGGLTRDEVRVFYLNKEGKVKADFPYDDPKGLGVAGILTDIFGLPSTLDIDLYKKIEQRKDIQRELEFGKNLSSPKKLDLEQQLTALNKKLDELGYYRISTDPLYQKFQKAVLENPIFKKIENRPFSPEEVQEQYKLAEAILKQILKEEP